MANSKNAHEQMSGQLKDDIAVQDAGAATAGHAVKGHGQEHNDRGDPDVAARLGLSPSQGEAVLRDASSVIGQNLSLPDIEAAARIFALLGDGGRLQLVLRCMERPQTVSELAEAAGMSQSLTSHHLRHLRDQRILASERRGRHIYYTIDDAHISGVVQDVFAHVTHD
ncbi:ArsR/SmtB family transcription factor [Thalassospira mesophila]|uniref:ArsR/SmtB family transcription factor n=1 Tax=Thalassospira mesophila TaxID=1293891 RepID=UPI001FE3F9CA|nr:metalloregulator ArsR/SmtB family transcription factor [Thalassospira mesophila]